MKIESRLTNKVRALASISSAGGMPERLRKQCDDGTPWLKSNAPLMFHGQWIGDIYAGARLAKLPKTEDEWGNLYFSRTLAQDQLDQAFQLGQNMVRAIQDNRLKPVTMDSMLGPAARALLRTLNVFSPIYRTVD